eukprot:scaffold543_cov312-Prasinococcus_capsulatus_cf.AAC.3
MPQQAPPAVRKPRPWVSAHVLWSVQCSLRWTDEVLDETAANVPRYRIYRAGSEPRRRRWDLPDEGSGSATFPLPPDWPRMTSSGQSHPCRGARAVSLRRAPHRDLCRGRGTSWPGAGALPPSPPKVLAQQRGPASGRPAGHLPHPNTPVRVWAHSRALRGRRRPLASPAGRHR